MIKDRGGPPVEVVELRNCHTGHYQTVDETAGALARDGVWPLPGFGFHG